MEPIFIVLIAFGVFILISSLVFLLILYLILREKKKMKQKLSSLNMIMAQDIDILKLIIGLFKTHSWWISSEDDISFELFNLETELNKNRSSLKTSIFVAHLKVQKIATVHESELNEIEVQYLNSLKELTENYRSKMVSYNKKAAGFNQLINSSFMNIVAGLLKIKKIELLN